MVKKVWRTDRRKDRRTDWTSHMTGWSQLKSSGAMVDMMSENARMICYGFVDFIGEL